MPAICYTPRTFSASNMRLIYQAIDICEAYQRQGYDLTLRQLYYQFVSRDIIPNKDTEYKHLGQVINDARLAGYVDWDFITDRTRNLRDRSHWGQPSDIVSGAARSYHIDLWDDQDERLEVWIEKDALIGVIAGVCESNDVPYFSCRGYTSQSEVWAAAQRIGKQIDDGYTVTIIHLGDHDPSGIDMSRDIEDRLLLFLQGDGRDASALTVRRIALNYSQVEQYRPPPNPAKITDSRAEKYIARHGRQSWELDALEPTVIGALIQQQIDFRRDADKWNAAVARMETERKVLTAISDRYHEVVSFLGNGAA